MKPKNFPGMKYQRRLNAYQRMIDNQSNDLMSIKNVLRHLSGTYDDYRNIRTKKDRSNKAKLA